MKYRVYTNESFERYVDYISLGKKFEGRWDTLDLDDVVATIDIPSDAEVDSSVRKLDLVDDVVDKHDSSIEVGSDGKIRELDYDDDKVSNKSNSSTNKSTRVMSLDLDDKGKDTSSSDTVGTIGSLDYDDKGKDVSVNKSNVGAIGSLDYDDDVDVSDIAASIDDVYVGLTSDDVRRVKKLIKRYAVDLKNEDRLKEIMLTHAIKLNYECLKVMCGDMQIKLTAKEKDLGFIDREDIKDALDRFKKIASKLDGNGNTYGLIPNAIVQCSSEEDQIKCANIIDFLITWLDLPVFPIYVRGAITRKLYSIADICLSNIPDNSIKAELLTGRKGLLTRVKDFTDIPKDVITKLFSKSVNKSTPSKVVGDLIILGANNNVPDIAKNVASIFGKNSGMFTMISNYIEDVNSSAYNKVKKYFE